MNLELFAVLLGTMTVTSYRSVPAQTDSTPYITSIGERVNPHGVAVSRDLLCPLIREDGTDHKKLHSPDTCPYKNMIHYGDTIYIEGYGMKFVNDCMGATKLTEAPARSKKKYKRVKITQAVDIWVKTKAEEKAIDVRHRQVWLVRDKNPFSLVTSHTPRKPFYYPVKLVVNWVRSLYGK